MKHRIDCDLGVDCTCSRRRQEFTIEGRLPGLNDIVGKARTNRFGAAAEKRKLTALCAKAAGKLKPVKGPVSIDIYWMERDTRRDVDNIQAGQKFVLDGIVQAEIIPDDNRRFVTAVRHFVTVDKLRPRIVVAITEAE